MIETAQDAEQDALIAETEELAVFAREYLEYHLGLLGVAPDSNLITFLEDNASFEILIRHDFLAVALVAIGLSNKDGANLHEAQEQSDKAKSAKLMAKLHKYQLTVSATHLRLANHVGEVTCEVALPLVSARLRDPRITYTIDLHHISLAVLAGIQTISAINGKVSPTKARLYEDQPPISLAYFPDSKTAQLKVGNGVYRLQATAPEGKIEPEQAIDPTQAQPVDAKAMARAFRALRVCMGRPRENADQPIWFEGTTAITGNYEAVGRFTSNAPLVTGILGVQRKYLDRLATLFAYRFKATTSYEVRGDRLIVSDQLLQCSCPAITGSDALPEYQFDARDNVRSYHVQRSPLVLHGNLLRYIEPKKGCEFIELTPVNDFQAALESDELQSALRPHGADMAGSCELNGAQLILSTKYGQSAGSTKVEMRPVATYPATEIVTRKVSARLLLNTAAFHSEPLVDFHFLDDRLIIESCRDDETCTYMLAYVLDV